MRRTTLHLLAPVLALSAGIVLAQPAPTPPAGPGQGMGPGMMGGQGPGYGMGPGMMGGYGQGYGMGPGMMGGYGRGYGMGPDMMGGSGMGPGMMGPGAGPAMWLPDLTESQRAEVAKIHDEARRKHWDLAGKMQDEMAKMRDAMWSSGKRDRAALFAAMDKMNEIRKQRIEIALDAAERMEKILTPEQREQLRRMGPWWMHGAQ